VKNPWLAKNPFLSMWMSAANRTMGTARGHALNLARREHSAMMRDASRSVLAFWFPSASTPRAASRKRRSGAR
jgi:hypothetical protein